MVHEDQKLSKILTREAFENAIRVNAAIGGSTNAVVHLLAIAGRIGVKLELDDFDRLARDVPVLVNLMPSGKYLMEEFFDAGGLPAVMKEIESLLHTDHITVSGKSVAQNIENAKSWNDDVITPMATPFQKAGSGIVVVRGSLLQMEQFSKYLLQLLRYCITAVLQWSSIALKSIYKLQTIQI
jgi:dihydroxy-acid dehydratase